MKPKEETIYSVFSLDTEQLKFEYKTAVEWYDKQGKKLRTTKNAMKRIYRSKYSDNIKNALIFLIGLRCGIQVGIKRAMKHREAVEIIAQKNSSVKS
jgi:hypothetical protein